MSYAICRVQKIKASGIGGLQAHNQREHEKSYTNPDIDWSRKNLNYTLIENSQGKSFNTLADERIAQAYTGKKAVRKDAVKLCEALFTSDKDFFDKLPQQEQHQFFKDCYNWACDRYGKENIISAIVHLDENTPHLHIDFVPLTYDGRLSAKSVIGNKSDLQAMQDDYYDKIGKPWGMERGERADFDDPKAEKPRKHLETAEYKRQQLKNEIQELEKIKEKLENEVLSLPAKAETNNRLIFYLNKSCGIDLQILQSLIINGKLYQDIENKACFVGYKPAHISKIPIIENNRLKEKTGEKEYSFRMDGNNKNCVYVFSSPIEAISHASTYRHYKGENSWREHTRISLSGVTDKALAEYLKNNPGIEEIIFCMTGIGTTFQKDYMKKYSKIGYKVRLIEPRYKSFNEDLLYLRKTINTATTEIEQSEKKKGLSL